MKTTNLAIDTNGNLIYDCGFTNKSFILTIIGISMIYKLSPTLDEVIYLFE
jgi:uncharacterized membrane protein